MSIFARWSCILRSTTEPQVQKTKCSSSSSSSSVPVCVVRILDLTDYTYNTHSEYTDTAHTILRILAPGAENKQRHHYETNGRNDLQTRARRRKPRVGRYYTSSSVVPGFAAAVLFSNSSYLSALNSYPIGNPLLRSMKSRGSKVPSKGGPCRRLITFLHHYDASYVHLVSGSRVPNGSGPGGCQVGAGSVKASTNEIL